MGSRLVRLLSLTFVICFTPVRPQIRAQQIVSRPANVSDWRAFHRTNDEYWAHLVTMTSGWRNLNPPQKIAISARDVRAIRLLAGISDDEPYDPIVQLIGRGMPIDDYLLMTVNLNGCFNIRVYHAGIRHFRQIWSIDSLPNGEKICQVPGCIPPSVFVGVKGQNKHEIEIVVPVGPSAQDSECTEYSAASYVPGKQTFLLRAQRTGSYLSEVNAAVAASIRETFMRAIGPGEPLVVIASSAALSSNDDTVVLKQTPNGISVLQLHSNPQHEHAMLQAGQSVFGSSSQPPSIPTVTTLDIPQAHAQDLLTSLRQIDLDSDRCPRRPDGECANLIDGKMFYVRVGKLPQITLNDVKPLPGYASENPALSAWIYKLLDEIQHAKTLAVK